jgi:TPR repeat protein
MWFDQKAERQRTSYNLALENMKQDDKTKARAIETIQELSRSQFPAAMYMAGMWEMAGENVAKDPADGLALIRKAAEKKYGPAMFEVALRQIEGRDIPADVEEGLDTMRKAALLGSRQAQFHLGARYEKGKDVPLDTERAQRYYRLCASKGVGQCQYRLASLLLAIPDRPEYDYVEAMAWVQLAAEQGIESARETIEREQSNMTPAQVSWTNALKSQLVPRTPSQQ